jgi:hypothetical protein
MPAAETKGQPSCRHGPARKDNISLPVASSAPSRVRDGLLFNFECPARAPCRPSSPAEKQRPLTLLKLVRSRSNEITKRAQMETCCVESARVAPSRPVREAPYRSTRKDQFARSDKSHIVRHKIGRWVKATGGPGTGDPARPRAGHFMIAQCVLILRAREHRPRRRAPVRPHSANLEKMGARREEVWRFAGSTTPAAVAAEWKRGERHRFFVRHFPRATSPMVQRKGGF